MPLTRRQIYRRRRIAVFGTAALVLGGLAYLPMTLLAPVEPAAAAVIDATPDATPAAALDWPDYGRGAIGLEDDDGLLASYGDQTAYPMASITKLVLALVVLQQHPLADGEAGPTVAMTSADSALQSYYWTAFRAKVLPVRSGQNYTERELLEISLIESAANYAGSLSRWAFGSDQQFAAAATAWLAQQGLDGITVVEPTGLDPRNVATPEALVELGRIALADPIVSGIVGTKSMTVHDVGLLENTNELLGHGGVTGIKTGTLDDSGSNLLFSVELPVGSTTVTVVGTVLGGPGPKHDILDRDVGTLLATVQATFHVVDLATDGESFASYRTEWGQKADAVAGKAASLVVWADTAVTAKVTADPVGTGVAGTKVGQLVFTAGDQSVSVPLELSRTIDDPGPWWRLGHPGLIVGAA